MGNEAPYVGALGYVPPEPATKLRPVVSFTRADLVEFKPTDWLIEEWLVRGTLAGLVGPSGVGKSFLALDWACRVATGLPWFGGRTHRGGVFYLAGEGRQGLRKRIGAWERHFDAPVAGAPLYLSDNLPFLCEPSQALGTVDAIQAWSDDLLFNHGGAEPALVVIDTVARAMGGANENSAEHMGQLIRAMDWLRESWGATVLAVHHTGHGDGDRARGSSAFRAALDSEFLLKADDPKVLLTSTKAKDWKKPASLTLRKIPVEVGILGPDGKPLRETSLILQSDLQAVMDETKRRQVLQMDAAGKSLREIEAATGVAKSTASNWIKAGKDDK
jgi:hypothetical protein